jgi:hypothetical protein
LVPSRPSQNLSVVRRFIDSDHVFSIVPALSPFIQSAGVFIDQQHVPTVGWGISPVFCLKGNYCLRLQWMSGARAGGL